MLNIDLGDINGGRVAGTDIFLSYARQDRGTARMFAECLADEGFNVWWDASLRSGETFDEVIERNLRDAKAVVVLWSPASVSSRWVRAEAMLADRRQKLAPVIIEPCDRPIIFELTHTAELSDWTGDVSDDRWRTFLSDLHQLVDGSGDEQHAPAAQPSAEPRTAAAKTVDVANDRSPQPGDAEAILAVSEPLAEISHAEGEVHCFEIVGADLAEQLIVVDPAGVKIGRSHPADIILAHKSVSREHCSIGLANDELLVTDLNSTNGTYVDEVRISRATILPVGSVLRLGQISLRHALYPRAAAQQRGGLGCTSRKGYPENAWLAATS